MDKKNEKAVKASEMMELTPEQMDKVYGGNAWQFSTIYCYKCRRNIPSYEYFTHDLNCTVAEIAPTPQPDDPKPVPVQGK